MIMKSKTNQIFTLASAAILLFACSTAKKYGAQSFGGAWGDPKTEIAKVTDPVNQTIEVAPAASEETISKNAAPVAVSQTVAAPVQIVSGNRLAVFTKNKAIAFYQKPSEKILKQALPLTHNKYKGDQLLYIVIAFFIPFLGVALFEGGITGHFWLCLLLTLLLWLPGFIYALLVILGNIG
jgi:uncharacterized membrane protein YqaE (UPF0057 family)